MIQGILFDLYHTLTGLESRWSEHPPTSALLGIERSRWEEALHEHSRWRLCGEERDGEEIVRRLAHGIDGTISLDVIGSAARYRAERYRHALRAIPQENVDTLERLRLAGYRLALISNADVTEAAAWQDSPLAGLFEVEIFSCFVGCVKPEREIYELCLRALGLPAQACMFVGDGGSNELAGARALGLRTVLMSGVAQELWPHAMPARREQADHHIQSIPELLGLLPGRSVGGAG